jgi:hypothetical protein
MARKVNKRFKAELTLNKEKGGAWLATICLCRVAVDEMGSPNELTEIASVSAWKNASAGKKYIKAKVQELTPRKSVKLVAGNETNEKGKPISFKGSLDFRVEA